MTDAAAGAPSKRDTKRERARAVKEADKLRREALKAEGGVPWGFILVLLIGGAVLAPPPGDDKTLQIIQWLIPIILTAAYAIIGWFVRRHTGGPRDLMFVDNCYFIGFLFTQLALVVAFGRLWFTESAGIDAIKLVGLIAGSLGASVVGLFFKVIFDQLVKDAGALNEQSQADLQQSASNMVRQLKDVEKTFGDLATSLKNSLESASGTIKTIQLTETMVHDRSTQVAQAVAGLSEAVKQLHGRFDKMSEMTQTDLKGMTGDFHEAVRQLETVAQLAKNSTEVMQQSRRGMEALNRAGEQLTQGISEKLQQNVANNVSVAADKLATELKSRLDVLKDVINTFEKELREVERHAGLSSSGDARR